MRPDSSVSVPQMMMALLENNPQAFYNGNINNLKMGHVLRISDSGDATSISSNDAARMASLQYEEWKDNRGMVGSSPSRTRTAATRRGPDGARVKLVSPGEGEDGTGTPRSVAEGSDAARLNEELSLAQEALDATRQETNELNSQMTALNDQIETMKRLVMLKDNQLVALQSQLKESGQTPEMPEATEEASPEMAAAMETEEPVTEQAEELAADAVAMEGSADDQAEMEAILSGEGGESQIVDPQELAVEESTAQAPVDMAADEEAGMMATLMALPAKLMKDFKADFKVMGIGVALILIIGGFVWMFIRRRKLQEFQESILTGQSSLGEGEAAADAPSEDASFMSDFAVSSMEGIQTEISDVDPISEADVYLAYGRYKQAEELINSAIETDPDRAELKLKSLEIHFSAKDKDAFELQAEMYKDSLGDTEHWAKVTEMGQELCPENEMFSGLLLEKQVQEKHQRQ
jgi:pilus assembly protein FimV